MLLGGLLLGAVQDAVDGGAADGEHLHEFGDGVLAACVHAHQLGLLAGGEFGLLALQPTSAFGDPLTRISTQAVRRN